MNDQIKSRDISLYLFLFLLMTFLSAPCFGQDAPATNAPIWTSIYDAPDASFTELQADFRTYWRGREIEKGHGYKPFKRWEAYMGPRIFPSNDMSLVNNTYFNYLDWKRKQDSRDTEKSFAGNWTALGPFTKATGPDTGVGRINMIRFDPSNTQIIYVGAANGGLWKSINGGSSWSTNTDFLTIIGVTDLAIDPTNTDIMYIATGDSEGDRSSIGVLKSTDGGTSWNPTGLTFMPSQNVKISKLIMNPDDKTILLASTSQGVYRTTNSGASWTAPTTATSQQFKDMVLKPTDPNTVYATSSTLWRSTDNGVTFSQITSGLPSADVVRMTAAVTAAAPNTVYLMAGKQSNGGLLGIYKSTDSGLTFTTQFEPNYAGTLGTPNNPNILGNNEDGSDAAGQSFYTLALAASPTDADFLLAGGVSQWASTDGGVTWYISSFWAPDDNFEFVHADTHEINFSADGTKAFSACDGGISMYTDNAAGDGPWTDLSNNLNISQQEIIGMSAGDPNRIAVGLQDIGTVLNTAPSTWKVIGGGDGEYCFIDYTNDDVIVETGTNGSHSISTDGGDTFTDIVSGLPTDDVEFKSPIVQDPLVFNRYYAGGRKHLYRSNNQGTSWTELGMPFPDEDTNITEFKIAPSDNTIIYATNGFNLAKSTDGGDTWNYLPEPTLNASLTQLAVSDIDPNKVWVTYSGYSANDKVYKTTNGGSSWINISAGLPNIPFNTIAFQNGSNDLVYVGADVGVFHRDNAASTWTPFFDNLPRTQIKDLKIFYPTMKLRAGTYGRGTWETDAAVSSTLPVTLSSFTGVNVGKTNQLTWTTTEEVDLARYEVERSTDGINYTLLGQVMPLSGNESTRTYDYEDVRPTEGINYYRLKMLDLDGTFEYSRIVTLFVDDVQSVLSVFPNPATNVLYFQGVSESTVSVRVMDALGRTVIVQTVATTDGLNVSRLPNGTYFVEVAAANAATVVKRFVKK